MRRSNKDILIGLVGSLTDEECSELYFLWKEEKLDGEYLTFGNVRLKQEKYDKLIWLWGKDKTDKCIELLDEWLISKKITKKISHYKQLIGWVERKYYQQYPPTDKSLQNFSAIDTAWKARRYVKRIPVELRAYDSEVKWLVEKYGKEILN